ncbi:MAG: hypothetical protein BGO90_07995 [Legionella sp. 40-6]|nr:MAG: hypothetical protein BGO90_07995 [Legionella sp. 40-6]
MYKALIVIASYLFSMNTLAGSMGAHKVVEDWLAVITVAGGPAWTNPGRTQILYPSFPDQSQHFTPEISSTSIGVGAITFSLQHALSPEVFGQLGVGVSVASDVQVRGILGINDATGVALYQYQVAPVRAELKGKLIYAGHYLVQPYLSSGIGLGLTHSYHYKTIILDEAYNTLSLFKDHSDTTFAYSVGAGLQKNITQAWQLGLGYEFADWGANNLGGDGKSLAQGPGSPHLYTHELLISVSYLF